MSRQSFRNWPGIKPPPEHVPDPDKVGWDGSPLPQAQEDLWRWRGSPIQDAADMAMELLAVHPIWDAASEFQRRWTEDFERDPIGGWWRSRQEEEKREMDTLTALKSFNASAEGNNLDEMVFLCTSALHARDTYSALSLETPEWLLDSIDSLQKVIKERQRDQLSRELKLARQRLEALKSDADKRADLEKKIERLTQALA